MKAIEQLEHLEGELHMNEELTAYGNMIKVSLRRGEYRYYWVVLNKFTKRGMMWQECTREQAISVLQMDMQ
jgi:hypothetical protein